MFPNICMICLKHKVTLVRLALVIGVALALCTTAITHNPYNKEQVVLTSHPSVHHPPSDSGTVDTKSSIHLHNSSNRKGSNSQHEDNNQHLSTTAKKRLKVLLVTNYRSGSSFVGEFLKNNPSTFYTFEPLHLIQHIIPMLSSQGQGLINATFNDTASYIEALLFECDLEPLLKDSKIVTNRHKTQWNIMQYFSGLHSFEDARKRCLEQKDVSAKVIRQTRVQDVVPRFTDQGAFVLYLVRDPRGTFSSRVKIKAGMKDPTAYLNEKGVLKKQRKKVQSHCENLSKNLQYLKDNTINGKLKSMNNVVVLRYEDFAYHPLKMAKLLYGFLGIDLPTSVESFINVSTNAPHDTKLRRHGVVRDSAKNAENWRTYLPYVYVELIQNICSKTLSDFGFDRLTNTSLTQIQNSVVLPIPENMPHL